MAVTTGNDGVIHIGGNAVASVRAWTLNRSAARVDVTVLGNSSRSSLAGFSDGTGTVTVLWDETDTTGQEAMMTALENKTGVALVLYPKGNSSNLPRITIANGVLLGVQDSGGLDEPLERVFEFGKSSGEIVEDVVP